MNSQTSSSRADLELVEVVLREVLMGDFKQEAKADATSLDHMLVHIVNMQEALSTSPENYANVAKRLGDFANSTIRMASRNPEAASKLTRLSQALGTASTRLTESASATEMGSDPIS